MLIGPANKTEHTKALELLAKTVLAKPSAVSFVVENVPSNPTIVATIGHLRLNVSELLQKADLNHVCLDEQAGRHYTQQKITTQMKKSDDPKYESLNEAEMSVIYDYTNLHGYKAINSLLYGKKEPKNVKCTFLKAMMFSSAINKIMPDINSIDLYRSEKHTPLNEINQRIRMVASRAYKQEPAFKSTSSKASVTNLRTFSSPTGIIFTNTHGKDISGLSRFPGESEYILGPEKIQWLNHAETVDRNSFVAQVVRPLDLDKEHVSDQDLKTYKALESLSSNLIQSTSLPKPQPILHGYHSPVKASVDSIDKASKSLSLLELDGVLMDEIHGHDPDDSLADNSKTPKAAPAA